MNNAINRILLCYKILFLCLQVLYKTSKETTGEWKCRTPLWCTYHLHCLCTVSVGTGCDCVKYFHSSLVVMVTIISVHGIMLYVIPKVQH